MFQLVNTEESFELIVKDSVKDIIFLQSHTCYLTNLSTLIKVDEQVKKMGQS